jgi:hypothetical protein
MSDELVATLGNVVRRLASLASSNPELVSELRQLAQQFLTLTEPQSSAVEESQPAEQAAEPASPQTQAAAIVSTMVAAPPRHEPLPEVPGVEVPLGWAKKVAAPDADLQLIEARCRLKAEGARWTVARQRRLQQGADFDTEIEPKDREIISKAKSLSDCFLWMNHPSGPCPQDLTLWENVAGCFDAVAASVGLFRQLVGDIDGNREVFEQTLDLAAEAQSALRVAVESVGGRADTDQTQLFNWLRNTAMENQTFVRRFMRIDDPANPVNWADIQERIDQVDSRIQQDRNQEKERRKLLKQGQYHAKAIQQGKGSEHDWRKIVEVVEKLIAGGIPASNPDLRELLLPIVDDMPDLGDLPSGFQKALGEIDRYLATRLPPSGEAAQELGAEVREIAARLKGKSIVLIGGERRPYSYDALKSALGLQDLIWIETREHQSIDGFEPYVARPDVAAIVLAIRWTSHAFGDVKQFCDKHGKPLVRLPAGYNPNQVAHQILQQCGDRLPPASTENGRS